MSNSTLTNTPTETDAPLDANRKPLPTTEVLLAEQVPVQIPHLYDLAAKMEVEMDRLRHHANPVLSDKQVTSYNQILEDARRLLPKSVALREDVEPITLETRPIDVWHDVRVTILPTLHNALPDDEYRNRG